MKVEQWILEKLTPYAGNPRKNDGAVAAVAKSIERYGFRQPIVVDRDGVIVVGHTRFKAAKKLGLKQVPVHVAEDLTEAKSREYRIADNSTNEIAEWDTKMLAAELGEMPEFNAAEFGVDFAALNIGNESSDVDAEPQIDKAEELRAKWGVELGQLWQLGDHRLLCGDSTDEDTVKNFMGADRAEVVFTDPPYGVNIRGGRNNKTIAGDITQTAIPFAFAIAYDHATTDDARLYFCGGEQNIGLYGKLFEKYCRQLPRHLIWVKNGFTMKPNGYHNQYEIIFHGYKPKGGGLNKWFGARTEDAASDVWQIKRDAAATYLHPTQKPIEIPKRAIGNSCPQNGIVFEPFSGSASTLIACEQLGRKCCAIELDPQYVAVALQRWADATGKTPRLIA